MLAAALEILAARYGAPIRPRGPAWDLLAAALLAGPRSADLDAPSATALIAAGGDTPTSTAGLSTAEIEENLGVSSNQAARLIAIARLIDRQFNGSAESFLDQPTEVLREQLLRVPGMGRQSVDRLLMSAGQAVLPLPPTSARVLARHGWLDLSLDSAQSQEDVLSSLGGTAEAAWRAYVLLGQVARELCGARPRCNECPLAPLLPPGGPYEPCE